MLKILPIIFALTSFLAFPLFAEGDLNFVMLAAKVDTYEGGYEVNHKPVGSLILNQEIINQLEENYLSCYYKYKNYFYFVHLLKHHELINGQNFTYYETKLSILDTELMVESVASNYVTHLNLIRSGISQESASVGLFIDNDPYPGEEVPLFSIDESFGFEHWDEVLDEATGCVFSIGLKRFPRLFTKQIYVSNK